MTIFALDRGMGTKQRETVLMVFDLRNGNLPTQNRVTLCAVRAVFPAVNVGMAIGAILSDVGKNRLGVAFDALHIFVQTA